MLSFLAPALVYLSLNAVAPNFFIVSAALVSAALLLRPRYFLWASLFAAILLIRHFALLPPSRVPQTVNGTYRVLTTNALGAVINHYGVKVNVPSREELQANDIVDVHGTLQIPENTVNFPSHSYLKAHNVHYIIAWPRVTIRQRQITIANQIKTAISCGPGAYQSVVPLLLFGERTVLTWPFYDQMLALGAVHLVAISGLNLNLLAKLCKWGLTLCKVPPRLALIIGLIPVLSYVALLSFPVAALRAGVMLTTYAVSKSWCRRPASALWRLGIAMMVVLAWKPYVIFGLGFIFTFGASLVIAIVNNYRWRRAWTRQIVTVLLVHFWTSLVVAYTSHSYALTSLPATLILTPFMSGLYLLTVLLWQLKLVVNVACTFAQWLIATLSRVSYAVPIEFMSLLAVQLITASSLGLYIITTGWNYTTVKRIFSLKTPLKIGSGKKRPK